MDNKNNLMHSSSPVFALILYALLLVYKPKTFQNSKLRVRNLPQTEN